MNVLHSLLLEEPLLMHEDLLEEVLVNLLERRKVILLMFIKISVEVNLRLQLPREFCSRHCLEAPFLGAAVNLF